MSLYNSLDRGANPLGELNNPYFTGCSSIPQSPAQRKRVALTNLGVLNVLQEVNDPATVSAVNVTATLTAAQMGGGIITSTTAAAVAATLPLGTAFETYLLSVFGTLAVGDGFIFYVVNTGANTWTLTANTGFTIVGVAAVAGPGQGEFRIVRTSASNYVAYRVSA